MTTTTNAPAAGPLPGGFDARVAASHNTGKAPGTEGSAAARTVRYALLVVFALFILMPMYVLIVTSLKQPGGASASEAWSLPTQVSFDGWASAVERLRPSLIRTVILAVAAAGLSSMLGSMNGFVFSRWRFPGAQVVFTLFLFGMFIPYQAVMIPLTGMMLDVEQSLPWFSGIVKLIAVHTIFGIPICTLIFRNYYATAVPNEILEAAKIDGAGMWRIYRSVVLPISAPAFVVTLIWQFTSAWNDFLFALFLTNRNNGPVTFVLNELAGGQNPDYPQIMAGVLIASLPTLLVYIVLGRYFIGGLMSGSVK